MGEKLEERERKIEMLSAMNKDRSMFIDKDGSPLTEIEWATKKRDLVYARVGAHTVGNDFFVSTLWMGIDMAFGFEGLPLMFETMTFSMKEDHGELERVQLRYGIESAARVGHLEVVDHVAAWLKNRGENFDIRQCDETPEHPHRP